jgi:putative membrane protein
VLHAGAWSGGRAALALLAGAGALGLVAEAVGVATGLPFGRYAYAGTLGPQVLGVPLLVPLAWVMMAYPALLAARRLVGPRRLAVALTGGAVLAAWDLFLDPQMVAAGHWVWTAPAPSLPGVPEVPVGNTAGWLLVGTAMTALLDRLLPRPVAEPAVAAEALPAALLLWTWLGSVVADVAFFGRPEVAILGGAGMAPVAVPYLVVLLRAALRRGDPAVAV